MTTPTPAESAPLDIKETVTNFDAAQAMDTVKEFMLTQGVDFAINLVAALLIFLIGKWVVAAIVKGVRGVMHKAEIDKTLETFVCNLIRMALMVVVLIAAIGQLGVETTSLLAVLGAAGLAVGLALQGSLSNFASGVLIVLFRPYKVGDFIDAGGTMGIVEEVQILVTIMKTPDNKKIIVPNSQIMGSIITNYSANDTRRVDMVFGVGYDDDIDQVRKELRGLIDADERILKDQDIVIVVSELADSSVNFTVRVWTKTADYWGVFFDMTENVKKRFDAVGISIPYPQTDVHLDKVEKAA